MSRKPLQSNRDIVVYARTVVRINPDGSRVETRHELRLPSMIVFSAICALGIAALALADPAIAKGAAVAVIQVAKEWLLRPGQ